MSRTRVSTRTALPAIGTLFVFLACGGRLDAQQVVISEIMLGAGGDTSVQCIELEMTSAGQTRIGWRYIYFHDATGASVGSYHVPDNAANGDPRDGVLPRVLLATPNFAAAAGVTPDFIMPAGLLRPGGGRVSFAAASPDTAVDSVAWGNYSGANGTHGSPAQAPSIDGAESLSRIAPGLNNATSFAVGAPTPTNNNFEQGSFDACHLTDTFANLSRWDVTAANAGLELGSCGVPAVADIGEVLVNQGRMLFVPGDADDLGLGAPIAFTGLTSAAAASFAAEPSYRVQLDMRAQQGIAGVSVFVRQHYAFDAGSGTIDPASAAGIGMSFRFDTPEDSGHVSFDMRTACLEDGSPDKGAPDADFTTFDRLVSGETYTVILDVDGDDTEGPLVLQAKVFPSGEAEPAGYTASWMLHDGLGADPDPGLDHGVLVAALGESPAALEISNLSVCDVPPSGKGVKFLEGAREPGGGITIRWENPFDGENGPISVAVDGAVDAVLDASATEHFVADAPAGDVIVTVTNFSGTATECTICENDPPSARISGPTAATLAQGAGGLSYDAWSSSDEEGSALEFRWEVVSAPAGASATIAGDDAPEATLTVDAEGEYVLRLVATDTGCGGDALPLDASAEVTLTVIAEGVGPFLRGDCNQDGENLGTPTDGIFLLTYLFSHSDVPGCIAACDFDGDGEVTGTPTDALYYFNFNFLGGPAMAAPLRDCDYSARPGDLALGCEDPRGCAP